ncbi:MAG: asparagine synthetase B, partial [Verrucomicrobia bacterium]|nr:asparagine synthetase B [Verrucomicrobiota bacterium]
MCGIFGAVEWRQMETQRVLRATDQLRHRGPDASGFMFDNVATATVPGRACEFLPGRAGAPWQLGFGHRRLSILDLATGGQPMSDATGSWWIIFNGEIYNHAELRARLAAEGATFRTDHSDTETLLLGFAKWGPAVLPQLNGMFAAAIYHRDSGRLWLIRDRFGKKPIYLHHQNGRLVFASELKAIVDYLGAAPALDH